MGVRIPRGTSGPPSRTYSPSIGSERRSRRPTPASPIGSRFDVRAGEGADLAGKTDRLDGLRRIGIDEIAHRRGHRYLTCVVDHDSGRLVWAAAGRDTATVLAFFDALGQERSAALTHVSADGAEWIHAAVTARAPQAVLGLDPLCGYPHSGSYVRRRIMPPGCAVRSFRLVRKSLAGLGGA